MDNAQKAIMIGVGLFITIIIISAVLLIVNLGTGLVDDATSELGSMATTLQNQLLQTYDEKTISGTQVKSAINTYINDQDVSIFFIGSNGTTIARTGANCIVDISGDIGDTDVVVASDDYVSWDDEGAEDKATNMATFTSLTGENADTYINTAKNYNASVVHLNTVDGVVVGIAFAQVGVDYESADDEE